MGEKGVKWKFTLIALVLGFIAGYASSIYLAFSGHAFVPMPLAKDCFKYNGSLPDAYCDSSGSLHIYVKGSSELKDGWYVEENASDCKPCSFVSKVRIE
ncbi:MAG: hypothetical protein AB1467_01435 [Candidatus Diapherotrites archaeon]